MNTSLKWIKWIGAAVFVGVLLVALLAGMALAQGPAPWGGPGSDDWGGYGPGGMMRGGMMGRGMTLAPARSAGVGGWGYGLTSTPGITGTVPYGYGPGGMMGRGMMGGMMGGWGYGYPGTGSRLTLDQAVEAVEQYLAAYGNSDLTLTEVMEFNNNFYAEVEEHSTGIHTFELLINPYTGAIYPEPGPNMMWNTKYGHMGGWWGYGSQQPATDLPVSVEQARGYAQQFLDSYLPGTTVADEADPFYGYYTLHVLRDGQIVGMLSVNGVTGQVWYHTWHGNFIGMSNGDKG